MNNRYLPAIALATLIVGCSASLDRFSSDASPLSIAANCPASTQPFPLINEIQRDAEEKKEAIFDSTSVQNQMQVTLERFLSHAVSTFSENAQDASMYAEEQARSVSLNASTQDPYRPYIMWSTWPGARTGMDNPDTVYRQVNVTVNASYEIRGFRNLSSGVFFVLYDSWPGSDGTAGNTLTVLDNRDLVVEQDGSFTVTLDAKPANGRDNHIQLLPGAHTLLMRDTLANWCETPSALKIRRLTPDDDSIPPAPEQRELELRAARNLDAVNQTWLRYADIYRRFPANTPLPPRLTPGGLIGQYSSAGIFRLQKGEAVVITVDPAEAPYQGFQLGSDYFASFNYWDHTSSLTAEQARKNADGSVTYVISLEDPGVWNWLDPVGHSQGLYLIRWQGLGKDDAAPRTPSAMKVALGELEDYLPEGMVRITPEERAAQIRQRTARVALRRGD